MSYIRTHVLQAMHSCCTVLLPPYCCAALWFPARAGVAVLPDRYVAQRAGLLPSDPWQVAVADQAYFFCEDVWQVRGAA
jgi:hypothetical protein